MEIISQTKFALDQTPKPMAAPIQKADAALGFRTYLESATHTSPNAANITVTAPLSKTVVLKKAGLIAIANVAQAAASRPTCSPISLPMPQIQSRLNKTET